MAHVPILIRKLSNWLPLGALALALAGCVGLQPRPDATRYYVLHAESPGEAVSRPVDLLVRRVELPGYLETARIVVRVDTHEVKYRSTHRWSGHLDEMIGQTVADSLERTLPGLRVSASSAASARRILDLRMLRFEGIADGTARVAFEWQVIGAGDEQPRSGRVARSASWGGEDIGKLVQTLAALLEEAVAEIAAELGTGSA